MVLQGLGRVEVCLRSWDVMVRIRIHGSRATAPGWCIFYECANDRAAGNPRCPVSDPESDFLIYSDSGLLYCPKIIQLHCTRKKTMGSRIGYMPQCRAEGRQSICFSGNMISCCRSMEADSALPHANCGLSLTF